MLFQPFPPTATYVRNCEILDIIDGDTMEVLIDDGRKSYAVERLRLYGCDTPETRSYEKLAGKYVTEQVIKWIGFPSFKYAIINSRKFRIDSFSRILCEVWIRDKLLNKWLLDEGLAWPTDDNGELTVDRDIFALNLPEQIKVAIKERL